MKRILTISAILGSVAFIFSFRAAGAYSVTAPSPADGNGFDNLFLPFQNFFRNINSVGSTPVRIGMPSAVPSEVSAGVQNAFRQFDDWLYNIVGFHISNLFAAILSILSWLLAFVKSGVDWLLRLLLFK